MFAAASAASAAENVMPTTSNGLAFLQLFGERAGSTPNVQDAPGVGRNVLEHRLVDRGVDSGAGHTDSTTKIMRRSVSRDVQRGGRPAAHPLRTSRLTGRKLHA